MWKEKQLKLQDCKIRKISKDLKKKKIINIWKNLDADSIKQTEMKK